MTTLILHLGAGETVSRKFAVEDYAQVTVSASEQPYTLDIEEKRPDAPETAFSRIPAMDTFYSGAKSITTTNSKSFTAGGLPGVIRVTLTNNSGQEARFTLTVDGAKSGREFREDGLLMQEVRDLLPKQVHNIVMVSDASDLPPASGGTHSLQSMTGYFFTDFVTSPAGLELGASTPLAGFHGSLSGFIHTGGATALVSNGNGYFARDMYTHAPGGTLFDLSADAQTEMLVESVSYADAANLGNIASLGTIDGYRVPSFKGCNWEDIDGGLTFDGSPDKIYIKDCPFRNVTASNVTLLTFADTLDVDIVDMPDNYVKGVQSDTEVVRVETGGSPTDIFQYRGTTHDGSVTKANVLTGEAGAGVVGYQVSDAYPLRDSAVIGELSLDAETETTINSQDTFVQVAGATTLGNESERMTELSNGVLRYDAKRETNTQAIVSASVYGANGDIYRIGIGKNGTVEDTSTVEFEAAGQNANVAVSSSAIEDLVTDDTISILVENTSSTSNITFSAYTLSIIGQ